MTNLNIIASKMAVDLEMLWHGKYYDIPLDGLALYHGEQVYFQCIDEGYGKLFAKVRNYRMR